MPGWLSADFRITLTAEQPVAWRASQGLVALPFPSGSIPPAAEDPFVGSLQCIVVDASGAPTDQNALAGDATLEHALPAAATLDVAKYNAIGTRAIPGANDGNGTLVLGGPAAEYNPCPEVSILEHFFDGAVEPITNTDQVFTTLALAPCSADYSSQQPGTGVVEYLIFNEFEQRIYGVASLQVLPIRPSVGNRHISGAVGVQLRGPGHLGRARRECGRSVAASTPSQSRSSNSRCLDG